MQIEDCQKLFLTSKTISRGYLPFKEIALSSQIFINICSFVFSFTMLTDCGVKRKYR